MFLIGFRGDKAAEAMKSHHTVKSSEYIWQFYITRRKKRRKEKINTISNLQNILERSKFINHNEFAL